MADNAVSNFRFVYYRIHVYNKIFTLAQTLIISYCQVVADVLVIITERTEILTLDTCTSLLPLLTALLGSNMDR